LRLRFDDFTRATRARTLAQGTASTETILRVARELLVEATPRIAQDGVTLVGIAVGNLADDDAVQLALPLTRSAAGSLDEALDAVRERFGSAAVARAAHLGRDVGMSVPILPD
jgi:DNA polymerase-4